jgi:nickel-dependent lactate racemase
MDTIHLTLPYGDTLLPLTLPEENFGELLQPPAVQAVSFREGLGQALDHPLETTGLEEFLRDGRSLILVINDETRPTPTGRVLESLYPMISARLKKVLVATGTHGKGSEDGMGRILGEFWPRLRPITVFHDCRREREMVYLGETSRGTPVRINQEVMMADRILVVGSVEPHYFSGYTGGRKAVVPGLAAYSTIVANHSLAMDPLAGPLRLAGNPVHEDLEEALGLLTVPPVFSIMLVLTPRRDLYAAFAGSLRQTLLRAAEKADEVYTVPFRQKGDVVIAVVFPPLDRDLYQSQKPIEHAKMALKEDGIIILLMACPQGAGNEEFQRLMLETGDPEKVRHLLYGPYRLGHHRLIRNVRFLQQGGRVFGVTQLDPAFLSRTFIRPMAGLQEALDTALEIKGKKALVHVLMDAGHFIPKFRP